MKKRIFAIAFVISVVLGLSACKNPPIFAAIEQEVKLKQASVKGFVRGVVKVNDKLYTSNGKISQKSVGSTGTWSEMSGCPSGLCTMIATDGTNLYASFGNDGSFKAYKYASSKWIDLPETAASAQYVVGTKTVFAFEKTDNGYTLYTIKNSAVSNTWNNTKAPVGAARAYCLLEDGLYAETGTKRAGTGSPTSGLKGICEGPANSVFVFNDSTLYCYDGSAWTSTSHGVSAPQSITYLPSKQLVLISGKNGYGEIKLDSGTATNLADAKSVSAGSSDSSVPSKNYYQYNNSVGKYVINPIYAFDYKSGYIIYTGVNDPNAKYTGLWGFYSFDKKEWNRE